MQWHVDPSPKPNSPTSHKLKSLGTVYMSNCTGNNAAGHFLCPLPALQCCHFPAHGHCTPTLWKCSGHAHRADSPIILTLDNWEHKPAYTPKTLPHFYSKLHYSRLRTVGEKSSWYGHRNLSVLSGQVLLFTGHMLNVFLLDFKHVIKLLSHQKTCLE